MRRWLLMFLLAVMPMQLSWAAVASYCQHEAAPAKASHFGHHQHDHQVHAGDRPGVDLAKAKGDHVGDDSKSPLALDDDCSYCHLGCGQAPTGAMAWAPVQLPSPMVALMSALHDSHFPQGLERPDRRFA